MEKPDALPDALPDGLLADVGLALVGPSGAQAPDALLRALLKREGLALVRLPGGSWRSRYERCLEETLNVRYLGFSPPHGEAAARFWSLVAPKDAQGRGFVRLGRENDGGYVMLDAFSPEQIAYSFGINDDVSFDLDLARRGMQVWMYDHTIEALPEEHPLFRFSPRGVRGAREEDENLATFQSLLEENGHAAHADIILKMDVEGAEWDALAALPEASLANMAQIALELHNLHRLAEGGEDAARMFHVLEKLRLHHEVVHIHPNNNGSLHVIGGYPVPEVLEITYARRRDHSFIPCSRAFPCDLDSPNNGGLAEIILSRHIYPPSTV